jgi:transcriptional regulator with XRE-family HTH domain
LNVEKDLPLIARRVKELREKAGLTQQDLAIKSGLSVSNLSQIEQGKTPDPRMSTLLALASALGVDCDTLTGKADGRARKGK